MTRFARLNPGDTFVVVTKNGRASPLFKVCNEKPPRRERILFYSTNGQWAEYANYPMRLIGPNNEPIPGAEQRILIKKNTEIQVIDM